MKSMNKKIIFFIIFFSSLSLSAQRLSFSELNCISKIEVKGKDLYVTGSGQKNGKTISHLKKISPSLKEAWSISFEEGGYNLIDNFLVEGDSIFISLIIYEKLEIYVPGKRFLVIVNKSGAFLKKIEIGNSYPGCSNLIKKRSKIFFSYAFSQNGSLETRNCFFATCDIASEATDKTASKLLFTMPRLLLYHNNSFITLGENLGSFFGSDKRDQFIYKTSSNFIADTIYQTGKYEKFGNALTEKEEITFASTMPLQSDGPRYIKFITLNDSLSITAQNKIYWERNQWTWVSEHIIAEKNNFWIMARKKDVKNYIFFIEIDRKGVIKKEQKKNCSSKETIYDTFTINNNQAYFFVQSAIVNGCPQLRVE